MAGWPWHVPADTGWASASLPTAGMAGPACAVRLPGLPGPPAGAPSAVAPTAPCALLRDLAVPAALGASGSFLIVGGVSADPPVGSRPRFPLGDGKAPRSLRVPPSVGRAAPTERPRPRRRFPLHARAAAAC